MDGSSQKGFITTAILLGSILIIAVIAVFASHSAQRGQFLYPLKRVSDKVELFLTPAHEAKAKIRFKILERHIQQAQIATIKNDFDEVADESEDFREEVGEIKHDIDEITEIGKDASTLKSQLQSLINNEITSLKTAADKASGKDKTYITQEIELTQALSVE